MGLSVVEKASRTDVGRQRQSNEDAFLERPPLFAVADGMGGARAGEVASRLAVEAFDSIAARDGTPEDLLAGVAHAANHEIYRLAQENAAHAGMGTTLTAVLVSDREIAVAHVGDSRLYRLREGQLEQLTEDHSLVGELVRRGQLSPEDAEVHPQKSIITRALGPEPEVEVDTYTFSGRDEDVYLLCSDGLTGMISEDDVTRILTRSASLAEACEGLVGAANAAGGKDNITVVLFRLGDGGGAADPAAADTLSGQETQGAITTDAVRSAIDAGPPGAAATAAREQTRVVSAPAPPPARRPTAAPRRRRVVIAVLAVVIVIALVAGVYAGSRQFWFVGTNTRGQVTLYRGLPYSLPLGIALYSEQYQSSVPASTIADPRLRDHIINHELRSHGDAVAVIRQLESSQTRP